MQAMDLICAINKDLFQRHWCWDSALEREGELTHHLLLGASIVTTAIRDSDELTLSLI